MPFDPLRRRRSGVLMGLLSLLFSGCVLFESPYDPPSPSEFSPSSMVAETDAANDQDSDAWYNASFLRFWFGDFSHTDKVYVTDPSSAGALIKRGERLVTGAAACGVCHASRAGESTSPLSGGRIMTDGFGEVRAANITPSKSGVAGWNIFELMRAIRSSIDRSGKPLSIDVHQAYRWMSDQDAKAISAYLLSLSPVENSVERRTLGGFERNRWGVVPIHSEVVGYIPAPPEGASIGYGRYVTNHLSACAQCHTAGGGKSGSPALAGADAPGRSLLSFSSAEKDARTLAALRRTIDGKVIAAQSVESVYSEAIESGQFPLGGPNIRGQSEEGLKTWSEEDIVRYLSSGKAPSGESRDRRLCPWDHYSKMPQAAKQAVALYLKSL